VGSFGVGRAEQKLPPVSMRVGGVLEEWFEEGEDKESGGGRNPTAHKRTSHGSQADRTSSVW